MVDFPEQLPDLVAGALDGQSGSAGESGSELHLARSGERLGINPQPEPPGLPLLSENSTASALLLPEVDLRAFNPPPEPPASFLQDELRSKQPKKV